MEQASKKPNDTHGKDAVSGLTPPPGATLPPPTATYTPSYTPTATPTDAPRLVQLPTLPPTPTSTATVVPTALPLPTATPTLALVMPTPLPPPTLPPTPFPPPAEAPIVEAPPPAMEVVESAFVSPVNPPAPAPVQAPAPAPAPPPAVTDSTFSSPVTPPAAVAAAPVDSPYDFLLAEFFNSPTTNAILVIYVAIVDPNEIPIGDIKVVGTRLDHNLSYESPLSTWHFEGYNAPGEVVKSGNVKFEPPSGMETTNWILHLEDPGGRRLSEDVPFNTDANDKQWYFIKFKRKF
ncbi:MAG: hypothetical protein HC875_31540 [Anaerolineales bacterium]|nr:hypothetical protein [Anaerolineales bacterium]